MTEQPSKARLRRGLSLLVLVVVLVALWEGYKLLDSATGEALPLPVRSDDKTMPHTWSIVAELFAEQGRSGDILLVLLLQAAWYTFKEAVAGFVVGTVVGVGLAVLFLRVGLLERGLMPLVVASQTVPLIALAPMVVIWGSKANWPVWVSVAVISAYLTFFPVAVNTLRGLKSPAATSVELMRSYAATSTQTLVRLRFPAALPYLFTALKVAATASIVGAIVAELPTGLDGGLGRALLNASYYFGTGPERLFATVLVAAALGLVFVGLVSLAERAVLQRAAT